MIENDKQTVEKKIHDFFKGMPEEQIRANASEISDMLTMACLTSLVSLVLQFLILFRPIYEGTIVH